jgi:20S proteasome alpha/beta subunit
MFMVRIIFSCHGSTGAVWCPFMTLLVVLKGSDGLALAADSRGTFGDPRSITAQNDTMEKAFTVSPHVAVLLAGAGELGNTAMVGAIAAIKAAKLDGVSAVLEPFRQHFRHQFEVWFPGVPAMPPPILAQTGQVATRPDIQLIVAGCDTPGSTEASIYSLATGYDFAPMLHNYGFAVAGVPLYATYLLNRLHQPDRSVEELTALAVYVITETASQDGKVGGPIKVITVRPETGCVQLTAGQVAAIAQANEKRSESLRSSFYGGANGGS